MAIDYEGSSDNWQEAALALAGQLNNAAEHVLGGVFRSTTMSGTLIGLFRVRDPETLHRMINTALDFAASDDESDADRLTVVFNWEGDEGITMTSLPISSIGDPALN
jgi:hypothetical protein